MRFASQDVVKWTTRDGLELAGDRGPVNYEAGQRYPLILAVHGGPESHVSNGWVTSYSNPGQLAAARVCSLLSQRSRQYRARCRVLHVGQADAAGKEFDDLVDAADHSWQPVSSRNKVGITGGS